MLTCTKYFLGDDDIHKALKYFWGDVNDMHESSNFDPFLSFINASGQTDRFFLVCFFNPSLYF